MIFCTFQGISKAIFGKNAILAKNRFETVFSKRAIIFFFNTNTYEKKLDQSDNNVKIKMKVKKTSLSALKLVAYSQVFRPL